MADLFRDDNTRDYTPAQLAALNAEWAERSAGLDPDGDDYHAAAKQFCDEVARRSLTPTIDTEI